MIKNKDYKNIIKMRRIFVFWYGEEGNFFESYGFGMVKDVL